MISRSFLDRSYLRARSQTVHVLFVALALAASLGSLSGCSWGKTKLQATFPVEERPSLAVLAVGMDIEITRLSSIQTVDTELTPEQEKELIAVVVKQIREQAHSYLRTKLEESGRVRVLPAEAVDSVAAQLAIKPGVQPTAEQLTQLQQQLQANLVLTSVILDYGKVHWKWATTGMAIDTVIGTVAVGAATGWNPTAVAAALGFELLHNIPLYFGGGYMLGIALRPVRVHASCVDTQHNEEVWEDTEVETYLFEGFKDVPDWVKAKKEYQLMQNLNRALDNLVESFLAEDLTLTTLRARAK